MSTKPLTPKQQRFCDEYIVDMNATQAAVRAGYSAKTASQIGERLLRKVEIKAAIAELREKQSDRTAITADNVLARLWQIATANPNDLIQHRRVNCRHCHGIDHEYQWRDVAEWNRATNMVRKAQEKAERKGEEPPELPGNAGGYGFDPTARPHPKCRKCFGEGHGDVHVLDTRDLSPDARALYAGVKTTKDGIEVKMHDQHAALRDVGRHVGLFNDKLNIGVQEGNPLEAFMRSLQGTSLKPVANPPNRKRR